MNAPSTPDQRQLPRRAAFIIAKYTVQEGTFRDIIRNIGAQGLFIGTWRRIAAGQPVQLQFPLFEFENPLAVTGQVVRSNPKGFAVVFDAPIAGLIHEKGRLTKIVHESDR